MSKQFDIGIIGGMGPRASAELTTWIYRLSKDVLVEQAKPTVLLRSNCCVPARNSRLSLEIRSALKSEFLAVEAAGCKNVILSCFSAHEFLPNLKDCSFCFHDLVDASIKLLDGNGTQKLVLCAGHLRKHLQSLSLSDQLSFPSHDLQQTVDSMICSYKNFEHLGKQLASLAASSETRASDEIILMCSELCLCDELLQEVFAAEIVNPIKLLLSDLLLNNSPSLHR